MTPRDPQLDELDRGIVRVLQGNGRTANTEIARRLGVTEATIRNRLSRLLDEGLIHIVAVPTPKAFGASLSAIIGISARLGDVRAIADKLVTYEETRYVGLSTGRFDIIVEAFFPDQEALLTFATEKIGSLDGVLDLETSIILRVAKFSYEWELP